MGLAILCNRVRDLLPIMSLMVGVLVSGIASSVIASPSSRMRSEIDLVGDSVESYKADFGSYPETTLSGTWYQKLVDAGYLTLTALPTQMSEDGPIPLDMFGFPFAYEVNSSSETIKNGASSSFILYSIGPNGVDEAGKGDDWDFHAGPRWGFWYKKRWPEVLVISIIGAFTEVAMLLVYLTLLSHVRYGAHVFFSASVALLLSLATILPILYDPYLFTRSQILPHSIRWLVSLSSLLILPSLIACPVLFVRMLQSRKECIALGSCEQCGYDLSGASHQRCPECGDRCRTPGLWKANSSNAD